MTTENKTEHNKNDQTMKGQNPAQGQDKDKKPGEQRPGQKPEQKGEHKPGQPGNKPAQPSTKP